MRSYFRNIFVVSLALAITLNCFGQGRSRGTTPAAPDASKTTPVAPAKPAATGALQIVTASLPDAEATRQYTFVVEVRGGKPPYELNHNNGDGIMIDTIEEDAGKRLVSFTPSASGILEFTLTATDSTDPQLKAEKKVAIKVSAKKVSMADLEAKIETLQEAAEDLKASMNKVTTTTAAMQTDSSKQHELVVTSLVAIRSENYDSRQKLNYLLYGLGALALLAFVILWFRRPGRTQANGLGALLVLASIPFASASTPPATPKVVCGDTEFVADFFQADGSAQEVICLGVKGVKVETGDSNVTVSDVKQTPKGLTFKITPATGATLDYLELTVDGKSIGKPIEIVSASEFRQRDRAITSLTQVLRHKGVGGSTGDPGFRQFMETLCRFVHGDPQKGKQCMVAINQPAMAAVLTGFVNRLSKDTVDSVFKDKRFSDAASATATALDALNKAVQGGLKESDVRKIVGEKVEAVRVQADVAITQANITERKLGGVLQAVDATAEAVQQVRGGKFFVGGGGLSKEAKLTLEQRLACAKHLALYGQASEFCPAPQQ